MGKLLSPFVGRGRGILGSMVMYHMPRYTGVRQRTQTVRNPQTDAQMVSRVKLTTVQRAYSVLKPICDHSFEGAVGEARNQLMFVGYNLKVLSAVIDEEPNPAECYNFNQKTQMRMLPNNYMMSYGTLLPCTWNFSGFSDGSYIGIPFGSYMASCSYKKLLEIEGHNKGIQYTFVVVLGNPITGECSDIEYCRVIMSPANGNMDTDFVDGNHQIVSPNAKNEGTEKFDFYFYAQQPVYGIFVKLKDAYLSGRQVIGGCMIASKGTGKKALRSTEYIEFNIDGGQDFSSLAQSIQSYRTPATSSIYLNQGT